MYAISNDYKQIIYSGDAKNKLKLLFNNVEYTNASLTTETVKITSKILSNGSDRFSLDNFVSKEAEIVIHDIDLEDIIEPISISIGTLVNNAYEYVPIGIFQIVETPTTDNGKTTIKLRDYSTNFDVPYSAEEVINANNGSATMLQILQDICTKCNITLGTNTFTNYDTEVSVWDNSINARVYIMYIAEKAGCIATMSRTGELIFVDLNSLTPIDLNPLLFEKYKVGEKLKISRVLYEDAIRRFEYGNEDYGTLYINAANPYIVDTSEIENIYNQINNFEMYSMNISKMRGNPTIDPWDILQFTYNNETYKFLGQNILTFTGTFTQSFDTQVGTNAKSEENVTLNGDEARFKRVFTRIDQAEGTIELNSSQITDIKNDLEQNYYSKESIDDFIIDAKNGVTNTFSEAGGNNIFRNTGLWFRETSNKNLIYPSLELFPSDDLFTGKYPLYEYWTGDVEKIKEEKAVNLSALLLKNDSLAQEQIVPNGKYTISFKYIKKQQSAILKCIINDIENELIETNGEFESTINVNTGQIKIMFTCNIDDVCEIYDLMVNAGEVALAYSQNQNETTTDTVNISKGITITSSDTQTTFKANSDGVRIYDSKDLSEPRTKYTDKGTETDYINVKNEAEIVKVLIQKVGNHVWFTKI